MASTLTRIVRAGAWSLKWVPVIIVIALSIWATYVYNVIFLVDIVDSWVFKVFFGVIFNVLAVLFAFSYFMTISCKIASPPLKRYMFADELVPELRAATTIEELNNTLKNFATEAGVRVKTYDHHGNIRFCKHCQIIKPDRACHCSLCNRCVLKYDHHCVWVNNCVHYANYKAFILFLLYGVLWCLWGSATSLPTIIDVLRYAAHRAPIQVVAMFFAAGVFGVSMAILLFFHIYLIAKNLTTIESARPPILETGPNSKAFNLGCAQNFVQVFGTNPWLWPFPVFSSVGTGAKFPLGSGAVARYLANGSNMFAYIENGQTNGSYSPNSRPPTSNQPVSPTRSFFSADTMPAANGRIKAPPLVASSNPTKHDGYSPPRAAVSLVPSSTTSESTAMRI